jgi:hypothetical protein
MRDLILETNNRTRIAKKEINIMRGMKIATKGTKVPLLTRRNNP